MFGMGGFSGTKLKPQLKMAVSRFQIASNKKTALMKQNMREVAVLLREEPPKEEKARIRAEALIRDDNLIEAYDILSLECELLCERIKLIENTGKNCPPDMISCISTLIYASQRVDIPELQMIRKQFRAKYGKKFEDNALMNAGGILNERVVSKLSIHPPAAYLVQTYLERICEQFDVDWKPTIRLTAEQMIEPTAAPIGYSVPVAQGTGLGRNNPNNGLVNYPEYQANTGEQQQNMDINYQKLPDGTVIPLAPPSSSSAGAATAYATSVRENSSAPATYSNEPPVVTATPEVPRQQNQQQQNQNQLSYHDENNSIHKGDDYDEPDIFVVPAAPSGPPGSNHLHIPKAPTTFQPGPKTPLIPPPTAPPGSNGASNTDNKKKDDDDDEDDSKASSTGGGGGGGTDGGINSSQFQGTSYANLAARFEALGK